jgi:hypothetical protein
VLVLSSGVLPSAGTTVIVAASVRPVALTWAPSR